jgi:FtsP/CotA-like multicopper oxidase with cupredoxin domain
MRLTLALVLPVVAALPACTRQRPASLPATVPNANTSPAGVLAQGVLTVALEAKRATWHLDGDDRPGMSIGAFAEEGKPPSIPAPLLRVPRGTEIRVRVRNSLSEPITIQVPVAIHAANDAGESDSVVIAPGAASEVRIHATTPGNYIYRATTRTPLSDATGYSGLLAGAIVVDTSATAPQPRDRVFMIMMTADSLFASTIDSASVAAAGSLGAIVATTGRLIFTINGLSWPRTERLAATVGDSMHWRILNASNDVHPMHLHGFYYRVDELTGPLVARQGQGAPGRMVVTERMSQFSAMQMTWVPDRSGNWIFHCHFAAHLTPSPVPGVAPPASHDALTGMVGLILGISVAPGTADRVAALPPPVRRLRLVAVRDAGFPDTAPSMRFELQDLGAGGSRTTACSGFSPTIYLTRGEPVSITVVNQLAEPTAVHWHGIELESYNDGVPGFSGAGNRIAPIIQPRDSFEARFTPPRAGTFIYHSHVDEVRQQSAGLVGAIVVRANHSPASPPPDEYVFFIKGARDLSVNLPLEVNGAVNPDTSVFHVGRPARLRFISLAAFNPNATVWLTARRDSSFAGDRDSLVVRWLPIAKDGADLPSTVRNPRPARQIVGMGETYDFEYLPTRRGLLRLEVRAAAGQLFVRVPIRVE